MAARTFRKKKVVSFSALFFMFTLRWITEKELERVIENKGDEFENERQWKIKANMNTGNKILGKHMQQFLHKNNV